MSAEARQDGLPDLDDSLKTLLAMLEPKRLFDMVTKTFKAMADRSTVEWAIFNTDPSRFDMDNEKERELFFGVIGHTFDNEEAARRRAITITAERNRLRNNADRERFGRYASHAQRYRGPVTVRKRTVIRSDWEDVYDVPLQ